MLIHPSPIVNGLIVVGESFWVFSATAQLRRLMRTGNTRGLSAPSQTLNAAGNVGWCTYFALNHLWYPFATNIVVLALTVALLGFTLSHRKQFVRGLIAIVIVGPLTSFALLHYPDESGWFAMAYNWLAATPELGLVVIKKKVSGISEKSLFFAAGAMLFTLTYALIIHSNPLVAGCVQGLLYCVVVFAYYYRYRKHG
jgi:hypothetical protein